MLSAEDLGPDFHFERDPMALASILNEEGITPATAAAKPFRTGLTPASKRQLNSAMKKKQTEYDFFEGKNGSVFYRPKPSEASAAHLSGSKPGRGGGGVGGFGSRTLTTTFRPRRIGVVNRPGPTSPMRRRMINTEKKMNPMVVFPAPHRQSISERKAIPGLEDLGGGGRFGAGGKQTVAKKSLFAGDRGENDSFEFAKPLSPFQQKQEVQSRAELILMREGLMGMPRESMSALLRQSLSRAELDKMFEDDSTENFEALEKRLKTPKRPKARPVSKIPLPESAVTHEEKENVQPSESQVEEKLSPAQIEKDESLTTETKMQPSAFLESLEKTLASTSLDDVEKTAEETPAKIPPGNSLHKELLDESNVVNVEIEEEELENEDEMAGGLPKSFSTTDLPSALETETNEVKSEEDKPDVDVEQLQPLMKPSISSIDLSDARAVRNVELASFYRKVLEEHEQHQEEMKAIEIEMKELMQKAKARREEFRSQWGVSPKSVNNLRTMKTMYTGVQSVKFSAEKSKPAKPEMAPDQDKESTGEGREEVATGTAGEAFDLEAEFNAVGDLIFNSAKKEIDPELTRAMTEAEILDFSGDGCQANLANAFDGILLDDEDMDITLQGVGDGEGEVKQSARKSALKKGVRFAPADEDDEEEVHVTLPKTPYSGAKTRKASLQTMDTPAAMRSVRSKAEMELAMLYEGIDGKEGVSSVKGKLDFE